NGGFLRKKDLVSHVTRIELPLQVEYHGYTIYKCGPWTQGPYLLQSLQLLKGFDLKEMGFLSADYIHTVIESMKLTMADRDAFYGDPRYSSIPIMALLSDHYSDLRRSLIDRGKASDEIIPGDPFLMKERYLNKFPQTGQGGTTTLCVSDQWGNVVVATPSGLGSTAGSGGETGIIHGTRLVSLNTWKGHPNCIEPGKRPRITLTPTLVLKNNQPLIAISIAGGDLQDQVALQLLLDYTEFGMFPAEAVKSPRFATSHHTGSFGQDPPQIASLLLQSKIPKDVIEELSKRGHRTKIREGGIGGAAMLLIDSDSGLIYGAGAAAGGIGDKRQ
ncbi:MAG: gamma-glutamyltransferase, partial [bacterium]